MPLPAILQRPAAPSNFSRRGGVAVDTIVLHTTQGSATGAAAWFASPAAHVSAHFIVSQGGLILQCVPESDAAWHAGNWRVNARAIGIECEGYCEHQAMWSEPLLAALAELVADLCRRHGVQPVRGIPGICGHAEVPSPSGHGLGGAGGHTDPGPHMPWGRLLRDVNALLSPPVAGTATPSQETPA